MMYEGLICGNSDSILKEMVKNNIKVDLILTDPPYNLNKDFGNDSDKLSLEQFLKVSRERICTCKELLKDNGSIIWFGIHHYIGFIQSIMYESGLHYRRMNIWYYENGFSRTTNSPLTHNMNHFFGFLNHQKNGHIIQMMSESHTRVQKD